MNARDSLKANEYESLPIIESETISGIGMIIAKVCAFISYCYGSRMLIRYSSDKCKAALLRF